MGREQLEAAVSDHITSATLSDVLWRPDPTEASQTRIAEYMRWLRAERGLAFDDYHALWRWSVDELEDFWGSIVDFFGVRMEQRWSRVLASSAMPGARWFEGARLSYAEHALRRRDQGVAILARSEARGVDALQTLSFAELADAVAAARAGLRRLGVGEGDRVAAYLPNIPEAVVGLLATASLGAVFTSCSPDFGTRAVVDRFSQIEPRVLLAVDGYRYSGRAFDRAAELAQIRAALPTLRATVVVPLLNGDGAGTAPPPDTLSWEQLLAEPQQLEFAQLPFDHPLWILYSSGTTGLPKGIVHGQGGILLEHLKTLALHVDLGERDRFFWFTTTGWMMWNYLVGGLLAGSAVCLYDGSPGHPDLGALWRFAADTEMTYFGTSAPYIGACMRAGVRPGAELDLSRLRGVGSTGAPLSPEGFRWIPEAVRPGIPVGSASGGTDVCTAFLLGCPLLEVRAGELQCRGLGAKVEAWSADGTALVDVVGELVVTEPMPTMPVRLWNDPDGSRYRESYFDVFPGVWRHGDWVRITERGSAVIEGRSDSTLNRGGVRMGTAELYSVVEEIPEVADSLVIDLGGTAGEGGLLLFVVLAEGASLDEGLRSQISSAVRNQLSPRHVPDRIEAIDAVPRTLNGKKLEVPVKRLLLGVPLERAVSTGAVANPEALEFFTTMAATHQAAR